MWWALGYIFVADSMSGLTQFALKANVFCVITGADIAKLVRFQNTAEQWVKAGLSNWRLAARGPHPARGAS